MLITKEHTINPRDPHVIYYNGYFYQTYASLDVVGIVKSATLEGLINSKPVTVFKPNENAEYSKQIWAPELTIIDDKCYIYLTISNGDNHTHRMFVLYNDSSDPMVPYKLHGKITDKTDCWAIDGTVFKYKDEMYMVWAGWEGKKNVQQNLYIAHMSDPFTIDSERHMIAYPHLDFETKGSTGEVEDPLVNEGPYPLFHDGNLYLAYSGSPCWTNFYCVALMKFLGGDIYDIKNWKKYPKPILSPSETLRGPGHASFVQNSPDGKEYIIYHHFIHDANDGELSVNARANEMRWKKDLPEIILED